MELMTAEQAAEYLGVSREWFYRHVKQKYKLKHKSKKLNKMYYDKNDLDKIKNNLRPCDSLRNYYKQEKRGGMMYEE